VGTWGMEQFRHFPFHLQIIFSPLRLFLIPEDGLGDGTLRRR